MNKILKIFISLSLLIAIVLPTNAFANESEEEDSILYRVIPESELTHIQFTEKWIKENDKDPDPSNVKITFPTKLVQEKNSLSLKQKYVTLRVPFWLLADEDMNKKADEITVSMPNKYFIGMEEPKSPNPPMFDKKFLHDAEDTKETTYQERWNYTHSGSDITGVKGYVVPYSYYNPDTVIFTAIHEIEFYGDTSGDAVEIASVFDQSVANTHVGICFWRNGSDYHAPDISVSPGDELYYEIYISGTYYNTLIIDDDNNWHYYNFQDTSIPSDFEEIKASSEMIDWGGGFGDNFLVTTIPISMTNVKTTYWQTPSYVQSVMEYGSSNNDNYVTISVSISSSGFFAYLYGGN